VTQGRASRAVGSRAETRPHKTQLTFSLTLELRHAVLLDSASVSTSIAFMTFISRGVTTESETHYHGMTAVFS